MKGIKNLKRRSSKQTSSFRKVAVSEIYLIKSSEKVLPYEVWHPGLLCKLKSYGVKGKLVDLLTIFMSEFSIKYENGIKWQCSNWECMLFGVA